VAEMPGYDRQQLLVASDKLEELGMCPEAIMLLRAAGTQQDMQLLACGLHRLFWKCIMASDKLEELGMCPDAIRLLRAVPHLLSCASLDRLIWPQPQGDRR